MVDYGKKTVAELTELLKARGLPHSGKKADLVARLTEADKEAEENGTSEELVESPIRLNPLFGLNGTTLTDIPRRSRESAPSRSNDRPARTKHRSRTRSIWTRTHRNARTTSRNHSSRRRLPLSEHRHRPSKLCELCASSPAI
jgi:hypothetical protein